MDQGIFFFVDLAPISSILAYSTKPDTSEHQSHKSLRSEPHPPYILAMGPEYGVGDDDEVNDHGGNYDGTMKLHFNSFLVEFWPSVSGFGEAVGLDVVAGYTRGHSKWGVFDGVCRSGWGESQ